MWCEKCGAFSEVPFGLPPCTCKEDDVMEDIEASRRSTIVGIVGYTAILAFVVIAVVSNFCR